MPFYVWWGQTRLLLRVAEVLHRDGMVDQILPTPSIRVRIRTEAIQ